MTKSRKENTRKQAPNERPADLLFWFGPGKVSRYEARAAADTRVSIGRTDSKRALGFKIVARGRKSVKFVLDKDQVAELAAYLRVMARGLRKPLGRKKDQISVAAMFADELKKPT